MFRILFSLFFIPVYGEFNPFSDDELFSINWAGPTNLEKIDDGQEIITVQTEENEKYHCVIPESQASIDASRKASYHGPTPDALMKDLFTQSSCSYRIESYWTYELCHGKHIKQYHEVKELGLQKPKIQEFYLGKYGTKLEATDVQEEKETDEEEEIKEEQTEQEILSMKIDGMDMPYYSVNMTDGTLCDVTGKPRQSRVMYICQPTGRGEIYLLKETSSCEYDIVVLTSVLCSHPNFKPKDPPVGKINCHAVGGSPRQPTRLASLQTNMGVVLESDEVVIEEVQKPPVSQPSPPVQHKVPEPVHADTNIGIQVDKQLLREFLNGDYCLHGGGGWWKHEFCYKKYAKQYHEDQTGMTSIYLGHWDKAKHLEWLSKNPSKRPKPPGQRKQISLFYAGGDICDLTNAPRFVEVKLKCLQGSSHPHAVSIYLIEPKACEYILGVESPILCDLLDKADNNGLLDHIKV